MTNCGNYHLKIRYLPKLGTCPVSLDSVPSSRAILRPYQILVPVRRQGVRLRAAGLGALLRISLIFDGFMEIGHVRLLLRKSPILHREVGLSMGCAIRPPAILADRQHSKPFAFRHGYMFDFNRKTIDALDFSKNSRSLEKSSNAASRFSASGSSK